MSIFYEVLERLLRVFQGKERPAYRIMGPYKVFVLSHSYPSEEYPAQTSQRSRFRVGKMTPNAAMIRLSEYKVSGYLSFSRWNSSSLHSPYRLCGLSTIEHHPAAQRYCEVYCIRVAALASRFCRLDSSHYHHRHHHHHLHHHPYYHSLHPKHHHLLRRHHV